MQAFPFIVLGSGIGLGTILLIIMYLFHWQLYWMYLRRSRLHPTRGATTFETFAKQVSTLMLLPMTFITKESVNAYGETELSCAKFQIWQAKDIRYFGMPYNSESTLLMDFDISDKLLFDNKAMILSLWDWQRAQRFLNRLCKIPISNYVWSAPDKIERPETTELTKEGQS